MLVGVANVKLEGSANYDTKPAVGVHVAPNFYTKGRNLEGVCDKAGDFHAEPYSAEFAVIVIRSDCRKAVCNIFVEPA
jgi:hypothetical protein